MLAYEIESLPERAQKITELVVKCAVRPLCRPRISRGGFVYQPTKNQQSLFYELQQVREVLDIDYPVIIDTYIMFKKPPGCKYDYPIRQRDGDEDNLRKALNDALVKKGVLKDDKWVIGGENFKFFGKEDQVIFNIFTVDGGGR